MLYLMARGDQKGKYLRKGGEEKYGRQQQEFYAEYMRRDV